MAVLAVPLLISSVFSGSLGSVIIPLSHELKESQGEAAMQAFWGHLGYCLVVVSAALTVSLVLFAEPLMQGLYSGFAETQIQLSVQLIQILAWLIPLNTVTSYLYSLFHAQGRYLWPAASGVAGPLTTVVIVAGFPVQEIHELAWAVLIGGMVGVCLLLPGFPRPRTRSPVSLRIIYRRFGLLLAPLVLGATFMKLETIVDRHLAASLSEGSISHLGYAWRLMSSIATLSTTGLSIVAFSALSRHIASGQMQGFVSELAHGFRFLCVLLVPMIAAILSYSETLVAWLFERGQFTAADTQAVAHLMSLYTGVLLAGGLGELCVRAFFALKVPWVPTLIGACGFAMGTVGKFFWVDEYQANGLAFLTSAYYGLNAVCMLVLLKFLVKGALFQGLALTFARTVFCTSCALALAWPLLGGKGLGVPWGIAISIISYFGLQTMLGDEFAIRIWRAAVARQKTP